MLTFPLSHFSTVGGVKRPAENFREAPSGKKNLPVVASTFVPGPTTEIRLPPAVDTQSSSKGDSVPVEVSPGKTFGTGEQCEV